MQEQRVLRWVIRLGMILFWIICCFGVLLLMKKDWRSTDRSITILSWSVMFDPVHVAAFERATGIRVYINHYESNEELLVKMRVTGGRGFDLVAPSDYAVAKLVKEGLIKPLDREKLPFFDQLHPAFLGHAFDPNNEFSIPYIWGIYCLVYDSRTLMLSSPFNDSTWDLLFGNVPSLGSYRVVMTNDPLEAVAIASLHLFSKIPAALNVHQLLLVQKILRLQKPYVEHYGNVRGDFALITGSAQVALMPSGEALRAVRSYDFLQIRVPNPTIMTIEHCAIPAKSHKSDLVYEFLSYMYSAEVMRDHFSRTGDLPARKNFTAESSVSSRELAFFSWLEDARERSFFVTDIIAERDRFDLWLAVKS